MWTRRSSTNIICRVEEKLDSTTILLNNQQEKLDCGGGCDSSNDGEAAGTKETVLITCGDIYR
jgi:hypothetical protein